MNKRRLLKLADLLEANAKNRKGARFNIRTWGDVDNDAEPELSCGTTVCAIGLAAVSGAFKRAGLRYKIEPGWFSYNIEVFHEDKAAIRRLGDSSASGFLAARLLFDLSEREAAFFFLPAREGGCGLPNNGQGAVAERALAKLIRRFVIGKVVVPAASDD